MKPTIFRPGMPAFRSLFDDFFRPIAAFRDEDDFATMPAVNVKEMDGQYHLEIAAPGLNKEDFKISVEQGLLAPFPPKNANQPRTKRMPTHVGNSIIPPSNAASSCLKA